MSKYKNLMDIFVTIYVNNSYLIHILCNIHLFNTMAAESSQIHNLKQPNLELIKQITSIN